jgi:hypothetical protein
MKGHNCTWLNSGIAVLIAAAICLGSNAVTAGTQRMTNTEDTGPGSLRQAILDASRLEMDRITFAISGTIKLTRPLIISKDLEIMGPGPTLSAVGTDRILMIDGYTRISDLTIANGFTAQDAGGGGVLILDTGELTPNRCTIQFNRANARGGGIANYGTLRIKSKRLPSRTSFLSTQFKKR